MRRMSFSQTLDAIRNQTKTVTRRVGWTFLKPGDRLAAVEKVRGFRKGEKSAPPICVIEVTAVSREPLRNIMNYTVEELEREGCGHMTKREFMRLFCWLNRCNLKQKVTRIEFWYV